MKKEIYYCVFCGKKLDRKKTKYCNNICKCRQFYKNYPDKCNRWNRSKPKIQNNCVNCGKPCGRKKYCSKECKPIRIVTQIPAHWKGFEFRHNIECSICNHLCFSPHMHHINGNHYDNNKENLIILCQSCHLKIHNPRLLKNVKKKNNEIEEKLNKYRKLLIKKKMFRF